MSLDAGDAACTHGLSKRLYDNWTGDTAHNGFINPLPAGAQALLKSQCYQVALGIVAEVQADFVAGDAHTTNAQVLGNAGNNYIVFDVTDRDTVGGRFQTSGLGAFWYEVGAGKGGTYLVQSSVAVNTAAVGDAFITLWKNGAEYRRGARYRMGLGINELTLNCSVQAAPGDTLSVLVYQATGGNQPLEGGGSVNTWVSFLKLVGS
jgi:hypothetical protein